MRCLVRCLAHEKRIGSVKGHIIVVVYHCAHLIDRQTEVLRRQWLAPGPGTREVMEPGRDPGSGWSRVWFMIPCFLWLAFQSEDHGPCAALPWAAGLSGGDDFAVAEHLQCVCRAWCSRRRPAPELARTCQSSTSVYQRAWSSRQTVLRALKPSSEDVWERYTPCEASLRGPRQLLCWW